MVVLAAKRRAEAERELRRLTPNGTLPRIHGRELGVGVLLYQATENEKAWMLGEKTFEWIGPWRPAPRAR